MSVAKGEITRLTKANNDSYSLRTTVPKGIARQFDLKDGGSIVWKIHPDGKELRISVEPVISTPKKIIKEAKK